jgi:nicotinamidase-related amidase
MPAAQAAPGKLLLSPGDQTLIMIDFQSQMAFATKSIDAVTLCNNAALVANSARIFNVSVIPTTVAEKSFLGPMFDEIKQAFPKIKFLDRTSMNTWEDKAVIAEVSRIGKGRIVLCGLWTSVCIVGPALSALDQGFEVYVIADACGDVSAEAHDRAMVRLDSCSAAKLGYSPSGLCRRGRAGRRTINLAPKRLILPSPNTDGRRSVRPENR